MAEDGTGTGFAGKRILVVEDEMIVAMLIEDILMDNGATVVGPAARVNKALDLLGSEAIDAALLDVNLAGENTMPVAQELDGAAHPGGGTDDRGPHIGQDVLDQHGDDHLVLHD